MIPEPATTTCAACGREQATSRRSCAFCAAFHADPALATRASFERRAGAAMIDFAGWYLALGLVVLAVLMLLSPDGAGYALAMVGGAVLIVLVQLALFFRAQTIGKFLLGLQVRHEWSGANARPLRMLVREVIARTVSGFFAIGYVWALRDVEQRTLHDRLTNTMVVRRLREPRALVAAPPPTRTARARDTGFTLDTLFRLVPEPVATAALVLVVLLLGGWEAHGRWETRQRERLNEQQTVELGEALARMARTGTAPAEALRIEPAGPESRVLWVRLNASADVRAMIDDAFAAHGLTQGFGPPRDWLHDWYFRHPENYPATGSHWAAYARFDASFAPRLPDIARAALTRRAVEAGLTTQERQQLVDGLELDLAEHARAAEMRRELARLGITIHERLMALEPPISEWGVRAWPEVIEARRLYSDLRRLENRRLHSAEQATLIF